MSIPRDCFAPLLEAVFNGYKKATLYLNPKEVVKVTFIGKHDRRAAQKSAVVTIGRPNYEERQFIKSAKKRGAKFPIRTIRAK